MTEELKARATLYRLRAARKAAGISQAEAGARLGLLRGSVNAIEKGRKKLKAHDLVSFCRLYRVTPNWMLGFCRRSVEDERAAFNF